MPRATRNTFRVNAKNFFLTYPHCNDKDGLQSFLTTKFPTFRYILIGRERHADGQPHLHSFLSLPERYDAGQDSFDFNGFHPNIQSVRKIKDVIQYIKKENDFTQIGECPQSREDTWKQILQSQSEDEFWRLIEELQPRSFVTNLERLQYFARYRYKARQIPYTSPDVEFSVPPEVSQWVEENLRVSHISTDKSSY